MPGITPLPQLHHTDSLVEDVHSLRNKVAHAEAIPTEWTMTHRRQGSQGPLSYADVLCEAAGSMVRLIWLQIVTERLQSVFSDKKNLADMIEGFSTLDVAQGVGLRAVEKVWFARGTTRTSPWCAVEHRVIDWASRSPSRGSSNSNHDRGRNRRDAWGGLSS